MTQRVNKNNNQMWDHKATDLKNTSFKFMELQCEVSEINL